MVVGRVIFIIIIALIGPTIYAVRMMPQKIKRWRAGIAYKARLKQEQEQQEEERRHSW